MTLDLARRIAFTLGALLVYQLGTHIPLPGVDASGILGQGGMRAGNAVARISVFGLTILPYLTSAIVVRFVTAVSPALRALRNDGERGRSTIDLYTLYGTILLAVLQSYAIAIGLEHAPNIVTEPGPVFRITTVLTLTGGVLFLVWLSEQITRRGIGNGIALIVFVGIAARFPHALAATLELGRQGAISDRGLVALALIVIAATALAVVMERARRRLPVRFAERQAGSRTLPVRIADVALKLNPAGVIPIFFASWLVLLPTTALTFEAGARSGWAGAILAAFAHGRPLFYIAYVLATVFFAYLYTAIVCDPDWMAESLARCGGSLPDLAGRETTADRFDRVISRTTALGATYLVALVLLPELLISYLGVPFYFGGLWVMTSVCVTLDIEAQVRAHLARDNRP